MVKHKHKWQFAESRLNDDFVRISTFVCECGYTKFVDDKKQYKK